MSLISSPIKDVSSSPIRSVFGEESAGGGGPSLASQVDDLLGDLDGAYYYDASDLSTVWQDDAGTTAGAVGQQVGRIDDKGKHGANLLQATAAQRPILQSNYSCLFDGVDDRIGLTWAVGEARNDLSVFMAIKINSDQGIALTREASATLFAGAYHDGSSSTNVFFNAGSPSLYIDGALSDSDRNEAHDALASGGGYKKLEVRTANFNGWSSIQIGGYTTVDWQLHDNVGPRFAIVPTATANANRTLLENWVIENLT